MSGIYIHIPFCKQACHYCDFHFSTSLKKKSVLVNALCRELELRKKELPGKVETIYFGGGTPSLLSEGELREVFETIYSNFSLSAAAEITLEANPDDLDEETIAMLAASPVNRLSIGIQSFFEEDLRLMNRAHTADEAMESIKLAKQNFDNISIDLIYGIPGMSNARWESNLNTALELGIPHISSYALTVEDKTALRSFIDKGIIAPVDEDAAKSHYEMMVLKLEVAGFENYEFSNFGKPGYFSRNNTAYWFGKPYLGIGPSAHSFDGYSRMWNVANNSLYINALAKDNLPAEREELSLKDRYNEYIMTRLRTKWGIVLQEVQERFGEDLRLYLLREAQKPLRNGLVEREGNRLLISKKGKFLSDGIAAELFLVDLEG